MNPNTTNNNQYQQDMDRLLRAHFPHMSEPALREEIIEFGELRKAEAGEILMDVGAYVRYVPLLLRGSIKVIREDQDGRELFLYFLTAGETCSMSFGCCMMSKRSEIRTIAEEDVVMITIPVAKVDEWMSKYKTWKNFVMQSYDNRMLEMVRTIDSIAFKRMDERLLEYLQQKSEHAEDGLLSITHQRIALDLNASREAVSRLLKRLEKDGLVELGRNQIRVRS